VSVTASTTRRRGVLGRLDGAQWRAIALMALAVVGLHALGFFLLIAVVAPHHYAIGRSGAFAIGTGLTAYTLGLRHAVDADHISAIDNTTRKLMVEGKRPMTVGFWFSLGHSTVVFALAGMFALGMHAIGGEVRNSSSPLHSVTSLIGTGVSGAFLFLIAALNLGILIEIVKAFRRMRGGECDEAQLEAQLQSRGLMYRVFGRATRAVRSPWHMYPVGVLFGVGFDTASEVALLFLAAGAAGAGLPFYAILCLPILFAAGMSLLDALDGAFMSLAYSWALSRPVRKVFYNLVITGLSVAVALLIGTIEVGGMVAQKVGAHGSFWTWLEGININQLGLIIVAMFLATWIVALLVWHLGHIEERWRPRAADEPAGTG
jgi:nickel/cobalt transporter (NiCoT) family protein